jgi:hypothetical protein
MSSFAACDHVPGQRWVIRIFEQYAMHLPVPFRLPRRQVLLFLIAILVPCGVLVALGLQMMDQERQLESKRIACAWRIVTLSQMPITFGPDTMQNARRRLLAISPRWNCLSTCSTSRFTVDARGIGSAQAPIIDP